jgi:microcystin-dependent protein
MADFTTLTDDLDVIQGLSQLPNQTDGLSYAELQAKFDEAGNSIKDYINDTLLVEMKAQGAAEKIGAVVGGAAGNVQDFIDALEAAGSGTLPPNGSVTNTMMATDVKIGSLASLTTTEKSSVQGAINELVTTVGALASLTTTVKTSIVNAINELVSSNTYNVGEVKYFAVDTPPTGYLKANGAAISRTTYVALFSVIGTAFGVGDGSSTFNLPDLRGVFPRGWDDSRGYDTGRTFGSYQADDNKAHTHTGTTASNGAHTHTYNENSTNTFATGGGVTVQALANNSSQNTSSNGAHTHTFTSDSTGATEVKVKNVALLACIKY